MADRTLQALGRLVRELRHERGLTQSELGSAAGYGGGAGVSISRLESGALRPTAAKLAGLAEALGLTAEELEAEARKRGDVDTTSASDRPNRREGPSESKTPPSTKELNARKKRLEEEIARRSQRLLELGESFNDQHERAANEFFMPFVETAGRVEGAPQPDPAGLDPDDFEDDVDDPGPAQEWLRQNVRGVTRTLASGAGGGAAAGAAVGSAAAYGTFVAAASFGSASTGAAISGLYGAAATKATLALLGGGTLATGGAGMAGGVALLVGIAAAPMALFIGGGLALAVKKNRKQRSELATQLDAAETELEATRPGVDALQEVLPRATEAFDYIATHAGHAVARWRDRLPEGTLTWEGLSAEDRAQYERFTEVAGAQIALAKLRYESFLGAEGEDLDGFIELANDVLTAAVGVVQARV